MGNNPSARLRPLRPALGHLPKAALPLGLGGYRCRLAEGCPFSRSRRACCAGRRLLIPRVANIFRSTRLELLQVSDLAG